MAEVIRKAGIREQTFYRWKAKYVGLEVDQVRQMAQLQEENLRLKKPGPDLSFQYSLCTLHPAGSMRTNTAHCLCEEKLCHYLECCS